MLFGICIGLAIAVAIFLLADCVAAQDVEPMKVLACVKPADFVEWMENHGPCAVVVKLPCGQTRYVYYHMNRSPGPPYPDQPQPV